MYRFTNPAAAVRSGRHGLWGRMTFQRGLAVVVYRDGRVTTERAVQAGDPTVEKFWLGGYQHVVSDADAALLTQAGYGQWLEAVS